MKDISQQSGAIRSDELSNYPLNDIYDAIASGVGGGGTTGGGGFSVNYPVPWFGTAGTQYWRVDNTDLSSTETPTGSQSVEDYGEGKDEDTENGANVVTFWLVPNDCEVLIIHGRYLKRNGKYGRRLKPWRFVLDDDQRAAGFAEVTLTGVRYKGVLDIMHAESETASGAKSKNPPNPLKVAKFPPMPAMVTPSQTESMNAWPNPTVNDDPVGYGVYGGFPIYDQPDLGTNETEALARIDLRNNEVMKMRVVAVGSPEKDRDGVDHVITLKFTPGTADRASVWVRRVGRRVSGKTAYQLYGRIKRFSLPAFTEEERIAGTAQRKIGPFGPKQARQAWHVVRVRGFIGLDPETTGRDLKEWYPRLPENVAGFNSSGQDYNALGDTTTVVTSGAHQSSPINSVTTVSYPGTGSPTPVNGTVDSDDMPSNIDPVQNAYLVAAQTFASGSRALAILRPEQDVAGQLGAITITSGPETTTEKDTDAFIRFVAPIRNEGNTADITAGDAHASEAIFRYMRKADWPGAAAYNANPITYRPLLLRKPVELSADDAKAEGTIHKKMGKRFVLVDGILRNSVSRVKTDTAGVKGGTTRAFFTAGVGSNATYVGDNAHNGIGGLNITSVVFDTGESNKGHAGVEFDNIGVAVDEDGDALEATTAVVPKDIFIYVNKRGVVPSGVYAPATRAQAQTPSAASQWRLEQHAKIGDEAEYAQLSDGAGGRPSIHNRAVAVTIRRKKAHYLCAVMFVKGSDTPILSGSVEGPLTGDSELPNSNYAHGRTQLLCGGSFTLTDEDMQSGGTNTKPAGNWKQGAGGADVDNNTANNTYWVAASHHIVMKSGVSAKLSKAFRANVRPGERLTLGFNVRTNSGTAQLNGVFTMNIYTETDGGTRVNVATDSETFATIPNSSSAYATKGISVDMPSSYTRKKKLIFELVYTTGTVTMQVSDLMLVRGNQMLTWEACDKEDDWVSAAGVDPSLTLTGTESAAVDLNLGGKDTRAGDITL